MKEQLHPHMDRLRRNFLFRNVKWRQTIFPLPKLLQIRPIHGLQSNRTMACLKYKGRQEPLQ